MNGINGNGVASAPVNCATASRQGNGGTTAHEPECANCAASPVGWLPQRTPDARGMGAPVSVTAGARGFGGLALWRESRKLLVRSWRHRGMSRQWLRAINDSALLRALVAVRPRLIVKPYRPYFSNTFAPAGRLALLRSHYEFIARRGLAALCIRAADTGVTLTEFAGKSGTRYQIALRAIDPMEREGELVLQLMCEKEVVCSVAFNFFRAGALQWMGVGCLQGPKTTNGGLARALVRAVTRDMHGLRPKHLMIRLAGALGQHLGCDALWLVGNGNRAVRKAQRQGKVFADYDAFWREFGATIRPDGDYHLACSAPQPPDLASMPSHKRSAARQRHALLSTVARGVVAPFRVVACCGRCTAPPFSLDAPGEDLSLAAATCL